MSESYVRFDGPIFDRTHAELTAHWNRARRYLVPPVPLPDREQLRQLMECAFWASHQTEEGTPATFSLVWTPRGSVPFAFIFARPVPLTPENVRKLALSLAPENSMLGVTLGSGGLEIWSVTRHVPVVAVEVRAPRPGFVAVQYRHDRVAVLSGEEAYFVGAGVPQLAGVVGEMFDTQLAPADRMVLGVLSLALAREMRHKGAGGTLIVAPSASNGWCSHIESTKYPLDPPHTVLSDLRESLLEDLREAMPMVATPADEATAAWEALPSVPDLDAILIHDGHSVRPGLRSEIEAVAKLANVDGALVVDDHLRVLSFGARVGGYPDNWKAGPLRKWLPVERGGLIRGGKGLVPILPSDLGGTRHESAVRLVDLEHDAVVFVASHDGPLTILYWDNTASAIVACRNAHLLTD